MIDLLRVHAYIRYSSVMQDDGFSVEYQISEIKEYCKRNGLTLHKVHIDQALTAKQVAGREAFFDLLNEIQNGEVDVVIVFKMNRMFRNAEESHVYRKKFRQHKVKIVSVTEPIDEETSAGRLTANMLANLDQYQSEVTADFVKSSHREMTRQGYFTGGIVQLGFKTQKEENGKKVRSRLVIDEEVAPFVRKAFEMYADGFSVKYILAYFRENNIKNYKGEDISDRILNRMLRHDIYIGTIRYNTEGYAEMIVENAIPAMIDRDLWDRVQERTKKVGFVIQRKRKNSYPLTGKIFCGECGSHFFGICKNKYLKDGSLVVYRYYICKSRKFFGTCSQKQIRADMIEQIALKAIRDHILNEEAINELSVRAAAISGDVPAQIQAEIKKIKRQIKDHDETLDLFIQMRKKREMSPETIARKSAVIEAEIEALNIKLADLESKNTNAFTVEDVAAFLRSMMQQLDTDNAEIHKALFENFIEGIYVTNDQIEVRLFVCFKNACVLHKAPSACAGGYLYGIYQKKHLPYRKHSKK